MRASKNASRTAATSVDHPAWPGDPRIATHEPRNLSLLSAHQILFRVGWIFKTESVIMPAFLDWLAGPGAGWLRGFLPVLNRMGQSVPPLLCAEWLQGVRRKKRALAWFTLLQSLPFAVLALVCLWTAGQRSAWMLGLFLMLYFAFFSANGLYHLASGTVQGKLIRPTRRGRLLMVSTAAGTVPAMLFAWWLLGRWLELPDAGFGYVFGFSAACFFLSGLTVLLLFEPGDGPTRPTAPARQGLVETWRALSGDRNLRRLVTTAMLFASCLIVFPHYQALARERLGLAGVNLMVWVIVQNGAVGAYSLFVGPLADTWGNRLTLRVLIFGAAIAPLFAASLPHLPGAAGAKLFWIVFIPLGITPLVLRILVNYTLEICAPAEHPRYLSTLAVCLALPFALAPLVGWLVDLAGYEAVFLSAAGLILLAGAMTYRLSEPRHRLAPEELTPLGAEEAE